VLAHLAYWLKCGLINFMPGLTLSYEPPPSASWVAGITGINHHT
jgi:hypothetical protein